MNVSSSAARLDANVFLHNQRLYNQQLLTQRKAVKVLTLCSSAAKPVDTVLDKQKQVNESAGLSRIELLNQVSGVLGCQWDDEGKGKVVLILAKHFHVVARYQI